MLILERPLLTLFRRAADSVMNFDEGVPPPPRPPAGGEAFLYVHVPFCTSLCPFCSFHRVEFREAKATRYFAALRREIEWYRDAGFRFNGVYVGGGTPTVAPLELERTLALIRESFPVREVSVETNPSDLTEDVLTVLERAGVNRLSVGVQSFDDGLLRDMERYDKYGSSAEVQERIRGALGRFGTLNVDMIFNVPRQTPEMLERDLDTILALGVDQVSFYPLMSASEVRRRMAQHMGRLDRRRQHDYYERIRARLAAAYRPSSPWCFDRGGQAIDEYIVGAGDYVGVGSGAFSYLNGTMYATTFSLNHYAQLAGSGGPAITRTRHLTPRERMRYEFLIRMFGRTMNRAWLEQRFEGQFARTLWPELTAFKVMGAVREDDRGWHLTERGMYLWVLMMSSFFEGVNQFRAEMRASIREEM